MKEKYKYIFDEYIVVKNKKTIFANNEKSAQKQAGKKAILSEVYATTKEDFPEPAN